jgi:hypothetical protein
MLILPLFAFVLAIIWTRSTWRLALGLLLLCPFLACTLLMVSEVLVGAITHEFNAISSFGAFGSFAVMSYLFTFPYAVYPPAAWLGAAALSAWAGCRLWFSSGSLSAGRRVALGAVMGTIGGGLFAALVVVSYFNPEFSARFGSVISMRDAANRFPPSFVPQVSIILGFLDGLLIAWSRKDSAPEPGR